MIQKEIWFENTQWSLCDTCIYIERERGVGSTYPFLNLVT